MTAPRSVLIVGESLAGTTAARHLRTLGHTGPLTLIGAEEHGACSRPPLSKAVLKDSSADQMLGLALDGLDADVIRSPAVAADTRRRTVTTADGRRIAYDALIIATGADARRLAAPGQRGELVLRTLKDARLLRARLADAESAIVIGAGFLGMEVASACAARGIPVTVVDTDRPLQRILGDYLSDEITARAAAHGIRFVQATGFATLTGDPVSGVALPDGTRLTADLVVTCAGEVPCVGWLEGTGLAGRLGVGIDDACATTAPGVFAAGDVTYLRGDGTRPDRRAPFWSNAVAQARTAAASVLGLPLPGSAQDDYFWTEVAGLTVKIVGRLPLPGEPTTVQGGVADGRALLTWSHGDGTSTAVAYGLRKPVAALRTLAATPLPPTP
ncbi:NAD(P)/FAD-dependent oxidoreductase [Streptomyces scabiei]|uniref:NAD(P)/FAD-dependent oxidoreductase n=1 Tax=Streptomyces scabiei TaxID=1930 RepID=UPI0004E6072E|nr:NAD(P)/FAD-dependent oxidoreductase [Streptomyces scabiei]KFG03753.1 ferredoxin reductase [Streptomyces scabiei]MDX2834478.1 NAD(P)/FAD-dependent oxidoreductase [Streptomyces scabiei]MDX3674125.1 NAD(P)/FAD-dependent oxidoreductase [Streptomyces scabiei]